MSTASKKRDTKQIHMLVTLVIMIFLVLFCHLVK